MKTETLNINKQELNFATYWQAFEGPMKSLFAGPYSEFFWGHCYFKQLWDIFYDGLL